MKQLSVQLRVPNSQRGVTLIEVLVALLVVAFGLLGAVGLLVRAQQAEYESYQRKHALMIVETVVARMQANRPVADDCYAITTAASGAPFLGTGTNLSAPYTPASCAGAGTQPQRNAASTDLSALQNALLGAGEKQAGNNVGALSDARGCVSVTGNDALGFTFHVTVVWKGIVESAPPAGISNCGAGLYGSEGFRRAVSVRFYVPNLAA